jgi:demethylmenaquinone methyltransferase/2-methoxy-6-polyprenyl-1,4-benzoquinol methylase
MPTSQLEPPATESAPAKPVDKSGARIRQMFGEISSRYDLMNHVLSGGVDYYWRWRTVRAVPPSGDSPILDVCTGTGDLALAYYKAANGRVSVVGSDFTREMLVIADRKSVRQRAEAEAAGRSFVFVEADTLALPFADDQFQIVSVAFGLRNVVDTVGGLREMARVCKPGGKVAVLEFSLPGNAILRSIYLWYFKNILPRLGQFFARNKQSAYNYLPESVGQFPSGEALARLMETAGLKPVTWRPLTFGIATLYIGEKQVVHR